MGHRRVQAETLHLTPERHHSMRDRVTSFRSGDGPVKAVLPWVSLQICRYQEPLLIAYFQWWPSQPDPDMTTGLPGVASTQNGPIPPPPRKSGEKVLMSPISLLHEF